MINMILLPESQNTKTGNIIQSYSSPSSCPVSCPFKEQCPAQTKGITCKECRLCSRDRESVVLFEVHGQSKGKARRVIQIKRAQH